ncbi:hypothetical protein MYX04_06430 [Nitrospiraceae bacterium AH_259_D15_M11_P09]|nr:hypothetical protein [Nitrospiraceae bacterium AH_259_D15_M11_P09]
MGKDSTGEEIVRRLNVVIALLLERSGDESSISIADRITKLADLGVSPAEIGRILGKPSNYVTATLDRRKGQQRKAKRQ